MSARRPRDAEAHAEARPHCLRCDKVRAMCLCARIPRIDNRTGITIVQHPRERSHPFGTARIARLGLGRCALHHVRANAEGALSVAVRLPPGAALLFPTPDAPVLESLPAAERPAHLVVLDGTWPQAKRLLADNPALAALPRVRLAPAEPSRYRIRREPTATAISTIEAVVQALRVLEPQTRGLEGLLAAFESMVDDQLAVRSEVPAVPRARRRGRQRRAHLLRDLDRVVVVCGELHRPRGDAQRTLHRYSALRLGDRALLDVVVHAPLPSERRIDHMGLDASRLEGGVDEDELARRLRAFAHPSDVFVAWKPHALDLAKAYGLEAEALVLKPLVQRRLGKASGTLADALERLGAEPSEPLVAGRAGLQLARVEALVRALFVARYGEASTDGVTADGASVGALSVGADV